MKARSGKSKVTDADPIAEFSFFAGGAPYADKDEYLSKALVFVIVTIEFEEGRGYEGADRWAVTVETGDGRGREIITLGANKRRNEQMRAARDHIAKRGPICGVCLKRSGRAYYLANATGARGS
jgi:hypothetical protein